jgi:HAD superfamily hydrolase (TIGR01509 family)
MAADLASMRALLFDLDGVVTPTAALHMRAWSRLFNTFLSAHGHAPDYSDDDYYAYVDGKPRYDAVRAVLAAKGVRLPEGAPDDSPHADTVNGLGLRKNAAFVDELTEHGIEAYPGSVRCLDAAIAGGYRTALVSSSRNALPVIEAAGVKDRFEVVVDGIVGAAQSLAGKPAPDTFLTAARMLDVPPGGCVVLEDAIAGVQAGRAGGFGLVIGVDRGAGEQTLLREGADIVVSDLAELLPRLRSA